MRQICRDAPSAKGQKKLQLKIEYVPRSELSRGYTRQAVWIQRNNEMRSCKYCRSGKAISIAYCECLFVALGIQHASRIRHIILYCATCLVGPCFCTLLRKQQDLRDRSYGQQCVPIFSTTLPEKFHILRKNNNNNIIIIIIIRYRCLLSHAFSPRYFSWTSSDPHRSRFKLHTAVLSVLCVLFRV